MRTEATGIPRRRLVILVVAVLLIAGLAWGIAGAFADSSSPSPAAGKVVLKLGWTNNPDNLNPFIGYTASAYEVWALNYDLLCGFAATDMSSQHQGQEAPGLATAWTTSSDGLSLDLHHPLGREVAGRRAADRQRRGVHVQLHHQERRVDVHVYTKFITSVDAPDDTTVIFHCSKPKANMLGAVDPHPAGAHLEGSCPATWPSRATRCRRRSSAAAPFQTTEWKKNDHIRWSQPVLLARQAGQGRRGHLPDLPEHRHDEGQTCKAGTLAPPSGILAGPVPRPPGTVGALNTIGLRRRSASTSSGSTATRAGPRSATPCSRTTSSARRCSGRSTSQRSASIAYGGLGIPADTIINQGVLPQPGLALDAAGRPGVQLRPGQGRADARRRRLPAQERRARRQEGKPIKLRLWARTRGRRDQCGRQAARRLVRQARASR